MLASLAGLYLLWQMRKAAMLFLLSLGVAAANRDGAAAEKRQLGELHGTLAEKDNEIERLRKALFESSQRTLTLSQARYEGGLDSNLRYLDAQRSVLANEIALVHIAAQQETAIVALFKALGGRWYGNEG